MISQLVSLLKTYNEPKYWLKNITWRFPRTISDLDVIFIVGAPRSGTTLLQRMLSVHSHLFSIEGETGLFSYQSIFAQHRKHFGLDESQLSTLFDTSDDIINFFETAVNIISKQNNGKYFVEKTPQHVLHLPKILKHFPNSKVIHIVRDGRDCYCSALSHSHIPQKKSISTFAHYWKKCIDAAQGYTDKDRVFQVTYESLVSQPDIYLTKIMTLINLEVEQAQLNPAHIGNDKRANQKEFTRLHKPINSSSVGRWKNELSEHEINIFNGLTKKELQHYHYEIK